MKNKREIYTVTILGILTALIVYFSTRVAPLAVLGFILVSIVFMELQTPKQKGDVQNTSFTDVESFLMMFAGELTHGLSPEKAFEKALKNCNNTGTKYLRRVKEEMHSGIQLSDSLEHTGYASQHIECRELLSMVSMVIKKDSIVAGREITQMIVRLRENRRIIEEENRIRRAMSFKVKVLVVTCSISLSIITTMLPMFSAFAQVLYWPFAPARIEHEVNWSMALIYSIASAISAYYAAKAIHVEKTYMYVALSQIFFWSTFLVAFTYLIPRF
jgi:Flp pilus assembly protein TadB